MISFLYVLVLHFYLEVPNSSYAMLRTVTCVALTTIHSGPPAYNLCKL